MNQNRFNEIVKNLANQRVQARVTAFNQEIRDALKRLSPSLPFYKHEAPLLSSIMGDTSRPELVTNRQILRFLAGKSKDLPAFLWQKEEEAVEKELLDTMNVMQQALVCQGPKEDEPTPADSIPGSMTP